MLKKSTLLSVSIFFLLFIGLSDYGYGCHRIDPDTDLRIPHGPNAPDCVDGDRQVEKGDRYAVTVDGDLESLDATGNLVAFVGRDGGGRNKPVQVGFQFIDLIHRLDGTSFFTDPSLFLDGNGVSGGANCFGDAPVAGNLTSIRITQDKDDFAYVTYWFTGHGRNYPADPTEILYLLEMLDGDFLPNVWRPANTGDITTVTNFMRWEVSINGNNEIACTDTGDFDVMITVENTTPTTS